MSSSNREGSTGYFLRNSMDSVKGLQNSDSITTGRTPHKPLLPVHTVNDDTAGNLEQVTGAVPNESELVSMAELKQLILRMENKVTVRLDRMENELLSMKQEQQQNKEKVEGLEHEFKNTKDRLKLIDNDIIPDIKGELEHKLNRLNDKVTLLEIHDRKLNLLFYGVEQTPMENVYDKLRKCWVTDFGCSEEDANTIQMAHAHRLPRKGLIQQGPDPIIVRFVYMEEREWFLVAAKRRPYNKDKKPVMVYTDLPPNMKKLRGDAAKEAKDLREEGKHTRIRVVGTKIVLEFRDKPKRGETPGAWTQKVFGSP